VEYCQESFGVLASDAGSENGNSRFAHHDFPKQHGFFFQREANEQVHDIKGLK
jgi:hypothetical protein